MNSLYWSTLPMKGIYCVINEDNDLLKEETEVFHHSAYKKITYRENVIVLKFPENEARIRFLESKCGKYVLLIDGTIYSITKPDEGPPASPDAVSMNSILLNFITKGSGALKNMTGAFSLIFLNLDQGKCIFARDLFGLKTGFYSHQNSSFSFASTPLNLEGDLKIDKNQIATLLKLRFLPAPLSLFKNTFKMIPGQLITLDLNRSISEPASSFFNYEGREQNSFFGSSSSNSEIYGELLVQAIERQLPKNKNDKIGVFLSGGLDSSVLAALLVKHSKVALNAFTVGFEDVYDENEIHEASEVAKLVGIKHSVTKIKFDDFLRTIELASKVLVEPLGTTSVIPMYHLAELAGSQMNVVFSGQGPDETGAGYKKYQGEWLSSYIPRDVIRVANRILPISKIKNESIRRSVYALSEKSDIKRFIKISTLFTDYEIEKLLNVTERESERVVSGRYVNISIKPSATSVEKMMAIDARMSLPDDLMAYTNTICRHFNLDCRAPFMDPDLVAFVESLERKEKISFRQGKITHRKFAETLLPDYIINRKKKGFLSPTNAWFRENSELLEEILLSCKNFISIFNEIELRRIIDLHKKGFNMEKQLFLLLSIYYYLKHNKQP